MSQFKSFGDKFKFTEEELLILFTENLVSKMKTYKKEGEILRIHIPTLGF